MICLEITMCIALGVMCCLTTKSDLQEGLIYNKVLIPFLVLGIVLDSLYYGLFVRDIWGDFLINVIIMLVVSVFLFFSHSFAGGDCKLSIVMALLYPARLYLVYGDSNYTLVFAVGVAIFYGYLYLLFSSVWGLVRRKNEMSLHYIKGYLISFVQSFLSATIYITAINVLLISLAMHRIYINIWFIRILCMAIAWLVGRYGVLKKWYTMGLVVCVDVVGSLLLHIVPISLNPENYILVLVLLLCQMTIKTNLYEKVEIRNLRKGMILSTFSSVMMQGSRVRGLPKISTEDLRDRLSQNEVDSIQRWADGREIEELYIVKKIPFAIFLFMGFATYFVVWRVL